MKLIITVIILCLMFNLTIGSDNAIKSADEAVVKALNYLGFQKMKGFSEERNLEKASIVKITNDKTPFLHEKINNCDIWKVTLRDIDLSSYKGYPDSVEYPRTFDVYIDPDDGTLLKIESIYAGTNIDFAPEPSIEWAEKQMEDSRHKFLGFASPNIKYVSLFDILNNMGPRNFKQLKALLIMNPGKLDDNPIAVWFVMYRGTDIIVPKGGEADMSNKMVYNYITFIYDALTGKAMTRTTAPSIKFDQKK